MQCHKISNEEAVNLLKENIPDVKVLEIRSAQVKGLWEFTLETKGQKGIAYIDFSKQYIISGSIFDIKTKSNLTQERFSEINKVDVSQIPLDDALVLGDKDAKYRVFVFSDPDCPYCGKLHQEMKKVIEKRKDIVFFIKMFPLPMHQGAYAKAKAIVCEKSLELLENAFEKKSVPAPKCETTALDDNIKLAEKLGIRGTPAIILPNGIISPGFKDADAIISLIEQ
jgi:thiol:disulfide interchange protein DsbC